MAEHRDEELVRIPRVDRDLRDLLAVAQPEVGPGLSPVDGLVHTVSRG